LKINTNNPKDIELPRPRLKVGDWVTFTPGEGCSQLVLDLLELNKPYRIRDFPIIEQAKIVGIAFVGFQECFPVRHFTQHCLNPQVSVTEVPKYTETDRGIDNIDGDIRRKRRDKFYTQYDSIWEY
jgi:hypothetical protein